MLNIRKILLPVDFPNTSLGVVHQAAGLARHFHSEVVILHVMAVKTHTAGVPESGPGFAGWDMLAEIIRGSQKEPDQTLGPELSGLSIQCVLRKGGATQTIVQLAQEESADLIMMPSRGHTFNQFLLGSATANVRHWTGCPVWTEAHVEESKAQKFAVRSVLCAVDFNPQDYKAVSWAAYIATEFGARLTLAHVTAGVEFWGPGGSYVNRAWKEALVRNATQQIAELQQHMGIKADVFIGSGNVPQVLCQAAKQTSADLLVTGCHPYDGRLRTHGYAIICALPIPVLNV
jgi:nucleotide-binding universal stress UspA family protein